jgi:arylsulfatase A-like enzyme
MRRETREARLGFRLRPHPRLTAIVAALAIAGGACTAVRRPPGDAPSARGSGGVNGARHLDAPYVILISIDGFRPDYVERFDLPTLRRLASEGARARSMQPVFPTLTFPNHYSLVTGLHPERHGIVGNSFHDPSRGARYSLRDPASVGDAGWYRGEPIWVTAERQGMVAACYYWPGSEAPIGGVRPTFWHRYDERVENAARVDAVLAWLRLPAERRPHLVTLYFSDVDSASHRAPLGAPEIEAATRRVDSALARLMAGLESTPGRHRTYLVATSDHGMVDTSASQFVALESVLADPRVVVGYSGPVVGLHVHGGRARAREVRDRVNARLTHGRAWLRTDLPARLRYGADARVGDVVIVMDEGWLLAPAADRPARARWGMHGWDNALDSMQAFFLVWGPRVPPGAGPRPVTTGAGYPYHARLHGLRPAGGLDGRAGAIEAAIARAVARR